jgi:hypothetical protein
MCCFDVGRNHPNSVAYLDVQREHASAIIVELELILGFDERGFGLGNPGSERTMKL